MKNLLLIALPLAMAGALFAAPETNQKRPNILFALADDWSFGHAGAYGCEWIKTPNFDKIAKDGMLFTRAYTPTAKCGPSRSCIITGRNPWQLKAAANHWAYFPTEFKSFSEALSENGYFAGMTGKGWAPGVAKDEQGKLRNLVGTVFSDKTLEPPTNQISDVDYTENFKEFLNAAGGEKPWVFWFGSTEPHRAYEYGTGVSKGGKKLADLPHVPPYWPDNEAVRNDMLDYAYEVEHFDKHLGNMLAELERRGELENTLIVVTSDNGMPFPRVKGYAYENSNHLPMAIMWKGTIVPDRVIEDYVSFIDLAPTFIEVAGLTAEQSGMHPFTGRSLTEFFKTEKSGKVVEERDHVLIGRERNDVGRPEDHGYPIRGIVKNDLLYINNVEPDRWPGGNPQTGYLDTDGSPTKTEVLKSRHDPDTKKFWDLCFGKRGAEEFYDLSKDTWCMNNLAKNPDKASAYAGLKKQLQEELEKQGDPRSSGNGPVFNTYPSANPVERDFYKRAMSGEKVKADWVNESDFEPDFPN
ncbi:sulfatase [Luteolibacter algae]|uniref:Sulfatase n=1 Tax=Luteolibacter algae TaxID=454151 RepID=A0ABW5DCS6_9BACT